MSDLETGVAQLAEHGSYEPRVEGSSPSSSIYLNFYFSRCCYHIRNYDVKVYPRTYCIIKYSDRKTFVSSKILMFNIHYIATVLRKRDVKVIMLYLVHFSECCVHVRTVQRKGQRRHSIGIVRVLCPCVRTYGPPACFAGTF